MSTYLVKRALPFILTLIFGMGLGSIFGGRTRTTDVSPTFVPARSYKGCSSRHRRWESATPSQTGQSSTTPPPPRSDSTLISR